MNKKEQCPSLPLIIPGVNQCLKFRNCMSYSIPVAAKSAAGFGDPIRHWRTGALSCVTGAFFMPVIMLYGSCARETFGSAGFLCPRFANLRTATTLNCLATVRGSSHLDIGVPQMKNHAPNPSIQNRIAALKARAISALHADSSLKVRLDRYNAAMRKARALESQGGAK